MNIHSNARTCPRSRALLVQRVLTEGLTPAAAAAAAGVSRRTAHKWLARFRADGPAGLQDRASVPRRCPHRTPRAQVRQILRLRHQRLVGWQIARRVGVPRSTVAVILRRAGWARLPALEPRPPVRRYEHPRPGDMLHVDIKKLGRIARPGHRVTGDRRRRARGVGWEYVHVCVDDHSRVAYGEVLPDERAVTATAFLERAVAWYRAQGIRVQRVLTDNGSAYVSRRWAAACQALRVRHRRTRPYTPRTNGKAERFIQTLTRGWAYGATYHTSRQRTAALPAWLAYYNRERPHASLNYHPPVSRLTTTGEQPT